MAKTSGSNGGLPNGDSNYKGKVGKLEPLASIKNPKVYKTVTLNPQLHSRSATYIKRNGLLIRKITIKSSRPFQCAYHPLTP